MKDAVLKSALIIGLVSSVVCAKEYSQKEIYDVMCKKCHGIKAEGNPLKKGPALNDMSVGELDIEIMNLTIESSQSSGTTHEIMEHNMKVIEKNKGMKVNSKKMAEHIYNSFNIKAEK